MSTYVMSDLHGQYQAYLAMLEKINFQNHDLLYILGDILDRGPEPIKILLDLMDRPNVDVLVGNHCAMACECLTYLTKEITSDSLAMMSEYMIRKLTTWIYNGGNTTLTAFRKCSRETQFELLDFISNFELYDEIEVNGKSFILVHGGLGNFSTDKELWDYELDELVWERPDYNIRYFPDKIVISGHTPTQVIKENPKPGYIYHANNHIAIDCGAAYPGGRLGCIRLDDMKEFYIEI